MKTETTFTVAKEANKKWFLDDLKRVEHSAWNDDSILPLWNVPDSDITKTSTSAVKSKKKTSNLSRKIKQFVSLKRSKPKGKSLAVVVARQ